MDRNPYIILGIPFGASRAEANAAFARKAQALKREGGSPSRRACGNALGRIDHLVMVGGSSKIPALQAMIADLVGTEPDTRIDPMTAIAVADAILQGIITDLQFFVGTEHALGTIVHNPSDPPEGAFSILIGRNTKYPAKATDSYVPAVDFAEALKIQVIEGDPDKPIGHEDNVVLKSWPLRLPENGSGWTPPSTSPTCTTWTASCTSRRRTSGLGRFSWTRSSASGPPRIVPSCHGSAVTWTG